MPGAFLQLGTEIARPVFPALLSVAVNFVVVEVEFVQFLRDLFPVVNLAIVLEPLVVPVSYDRAEEVGFLVAPGVVGESDFFEAEPLEHADLAVDSRDQGGYEFPVLLLLNKKYNYQLLFNIIIGFPVAILGDDPEQNLDIFFSPVTLNSFRLYHSDLINYYFSILTSIFFTIVYGL